MLNCLFCAELRLPTVDRLGSAVTAVAIDGSSLWAVRAIAMRFMRKEQIKKTTTKNKKFT